MKKLHWFFKACILLFFTFLIWFSITSLLPKILPTKEITGETRGIIFQNQIWRGEIFITGDLITLPNVSITIEPGSKIFINKKGDKNNFDILPWHIKHGINTGLPDRGILTGEPFWDEKEKIFVFISNLKASGERNKPIIITSIGQGSPYDINLIKILNGEASNVNFSNYRRLEIGQNVKIEESTFKNNGECSICITEGSPLIKGSSFKTSKRYHIKVNNASPLIKGNIFGDSEGDGVFIESNLVSPVRIFENLFQMPSRKGVKISSAGVSADISENNFILGDIELPCMNKVKLINNKISGKVLFVNIGGCSGEYLILENYWEILDPESVISARVSGTSDKFKVNIPRILKNPPKGI